MTIRRFSISMIGCNLVLSILLSACSTNMSAPTSTNTATVTATYTASPSTTPTFTNTPTQKNTPTSTQTSTKTPTTTPTPTPVIYDGVWSGKTSQGNPFSFTVVDNQIKSINSTFSFTIGNCRYNLKPMDFSKLKVDNKTGPPYSLLIEGGKFFIFAWIYPVEFSGNFDTATTASGTYKRSGKGDCGFNIDTTWSASKKIEGSATPTP